MNKFNIISCVNMSEERKDMGYEGHAVSMMCTTDPSLILFFPVEEGFVPMLNVLIQGKTKCDVNVNMIGLYKTMTESWEAGNKYLSGIVIDTIYEKETNEDIMTVKLILNDMSNGMIDGIVPINFMHAILLSLIERIDIIVTNSMLQKILPEEDLGQEYFPEDDKIIDIVKDILSSPVKETKKKTNKANNSDKTDKSDNKKNK